MANRSGNKGNSDRLYFLGPQKHCRWWLQLWNKNMLAVWKKSYDQPQFSSVQFSLSVMSDSLWPHESQDTRPPCPLPTPEVTQIHVHRGREAIQPSHPLSSPFSSYPQSFPASEFFPMSQLFTWGGQSSGVSGLASFLPKNTQGWSPLEWTDWISLQSMGFSSIFSNTTVQKHQFFITQLSSQSNSHIHWVGDAIQPPHPLSSPFLPAPNLSQYQSLFQWVNSSHEVAKVLEFLRVAYLYF